jgi:hypothetical protein
MNRDAKIDAFFDAIDTIEKTDDDSIIIHWKSNVAHHVNGHYLSISQGSNIISGHQVHFNPSLGKPLDSVKFNDLQEDLDNAVENASKNINLD